MEKTLLIFDFDGTIANTLEVAVDIANELSVEFGFPSITKDEFVELRGKSIPELLRMSGLSWWQLPSVVRRARDHFKSRLAEVPPVSGMPENLDILRQRGYLLGILTSNTQEGVNAFLDMYNLQLFEFIHAPDSIFGKAKRLREIQKKYRLAEKQMVMIGDEARDIDAAHKADVDAVAVTWGFHTQQLLEGHHPLHLIDHPDRLLDLFPEKNATNTSS